MAPDAKDIGVLDVALDPHFASSHQIFFTFYDYINGTNSNTWVARGQLDEAKLALIGAKVIFRAQPAMPSSRLGGRATRQSMRGKFGILGNVESATYRVIKGV